MEKRAGLAVPPEGAPGEIGDEEGFGEVSAVGARTGGEAAPGVGGATGPPPVTDSRERLLVAATTLFAARGYHGVSMRELATELGLNVATVHHHAGSKAQLYEDVIARLSDRERAGLAAIGADHLDDAAMRDPARAPDAIRRGLDDYLDLLVEDPSAPSLWMRCWLDAPPELDHLWERYALPLFSAMAQRLEVGMEAGTLRRVDPMLLLRTVVWSTHGYLTGGLPGTDGGADPREPERLAHFRRFLQDVVLRALLVDTDAGDADDAADLAEHAGDAAPS